MHLESNLDIIRCLQDDNVHTRQIYYREGPSKGKTFKRASIESFMLHSVLIGTSTGVAFR